MLCKKCGHETPDHNPNCIICGALVTQDAEPHDQKPSDKKYRISVIVLLSVIALAVIGVGIFLIIRTSSDHSDPSPNTAVTENTSAADQSDTNTATNTSDETTIAAAADQLKDTSAQVEAENITTAPTQKATDAPFSITQSELENEIEKIRQYYYSPTDEDEKIVLDNGTDGWNYSRDYRFHNGKLVFAFIFDGTEEHRLYFKDDHMIRYIDENQVTYDYPDCSKYDSWAEKALKEAYSKYSGGASDDQDDDSGDQEWLGVWKNENGERFEVTSVTSTGIEVIHHHMNEKGDRELHTEMSMVYTDDTHLSVTESDEVQTWKYTLTLCGDYLLVESRYPDMKFYKET